MEPVKGSFPEQKTTSTPSTLLPSRHFWSSMLNIRVVCNHMITGIKHNWKTLKTHTSLATFQIQWSFIAIEANDFHICRLTRDLSVASWYKPKPAKHWVASSTCFRGGRRIQKKTLNNKQRPTTSGKSSMAIFSQGSFVWWALCFVSLEMSQLRCKHVDLP